MSQSLGHWNRLEDWPIVSFSRLKGETRADRENTLRRLYPNSIQESRDLLAVVWQDLTVINVGPLKCLLNVTVQSRQIGSEKLRGHQHQTNQNVSVQRNNKTIT